MRTYGRVPVYMSGTLIQAKNPNTGQPATKWVVVQTDANGFNDLVYATTLVQAFKINLGESPFYANYGLPAKTSVVTQVAPDYNVVLTQQQFAQYFASLVVARQAGAATPTYKVDITTHVGVKLSASVPIAT